MCKKEVNNIFTLGTTQCYAKIDGNIIIWEKFISSIKNRWILLM